MNELDEERQLYNKKMMMYDIANQNINSFDLYNSILDNKKREVKKVNKVKNNEKEKQESDFLLLNTFEF